MYLLANRPLGIQGGKPDWDEIIKFIRIVLAIICFSVMLSFLWGCGSIYKTKTINQSENKSIEYHLQEKEISSQNLDINKILQAGEVQIHINYDTDNTIQSSNEGYEINGINSLLPQTNQKVKSIDFDIKNLNESESTKENTENAITKNDSYKESEKKTFHESQSTTRISPLSILLSVVPIIGLGLLYLIILIIKRVKSKNNP
jgi:hypothetical protein